VADAIRSSLGPKGMDKMIQTDKTTIITNDGATILKHMAVLHPAARMVFIGQVLSELTFSFVARRSFCCTRCRGWRWDDHGCRPRRSSSHRRRTSSGQRSHPLPIHLDIASLTADRHSPHHHRRSISVSSSKRCRPPH
jgi:TCP-1/cpn60 chaperonin family